ncbi:MAG: SMP-30/gluconolactonase/LRE family protein [Verrucomicrobiota bacterium]
MKAFILSTTFALAAVPVVFAAGWQLHPDAQEQESVPHGRVEKMSPWESKVFPGTIRDWSVYVPSQVEAGAQAALMVFQDGHDYLSAKGHWRVPAVFDNLIARGEMPPTIAVFINPGHESSKPTPQSPWKNSNRSLEYDSLGGRYSQFLIDEIIPELKKRYNISDDPEMHAICGASSGASCAFTVAWERPDVFRKVLSSIGSFVNLRGANEYPSLIRKTEAKPIRVYLADTSGDLDNPFGNWPLANKQMHAALQYMGYDVRFDFAEGYGHNSDHAGSIFPDAVKWLWRKEKVTPVLDTKGDLKGDLTLLNLLVPGQGWQVAAEGLAFADGLCSDAEGNVYFSDMKAPAILKVGVDGRVSKVADEGVSGLKFGPDGLLYACQGSKRRVISIDLKTGEVREIAGNVQPNDLAVTREGQIYITETGPQQVTLIDSKTGLTRVVDHGINGPNGITLSPDGGTLAVSEYKGEWVWTFRVEEDGSLGAKAPYMSLRLPIDLKGEFKFNEPPPKLSASRGDGMTTDRVGRYYVTSALGVQVFDPTGRICGVIDKPEITTGITSCILGGAGLNTLFVASKDKVYRRVLTVEHTK